MKDILVIEPFYGGSHAQLIDLLCCDNIIGPRIELHTLPAKKWHWRARSAALYLSQTIEPSERYKVIFSSSVLNLTELVALRPDLASLRKILYFHENQLIYPVQKMKDRDFHYGYSQILSTMVADEIIFNSKYNKESFLDSISRHLKLIPDHRPKNIAEKIRPKCRVIYFPLNFVNDKSTLPCDDKHNKELPSTSKEEIEGSSFDFSGQTNVNNQSGSPNKRMFSKVDETESHIHEMQEQLVADPKCHKYEGRSKDSSACAELKSTLIVNSYDESFDDKCRDRVDDTEVTEKITSRHPAFNDKLHIVWPHRWEHDKGPQAFFEALFQLQDDGCDFIVSVIGETFNEIPDIFNLAHSRLGPKVNAWGYQSRDEYLRIIESANVVVSTAEHEFFGVSMLEATNCGCFPLCPKRLVYPEIYPSECLYSTHAQLVKRLKQFCKRPDKITRPIGKIKMLEFSWEFLKDDYRRLLLGTSQLDYIS